MIINIILCIIAVILLILVLFLFYPVDVGVEYILKDGVSRAYLRLYYMKIIPIKIPLNFDSKRDKKKKTKEKKKFDVTNYLEMIKNIKEAIDITKDDIKEIILKLKKQVTFKEVLFDVFFDTGNAAKTGILTGAVWTGSTFLIKLVDEFFGINKVNVNVTPTFNGKCFNIHVKSILRLKAVNIIIIIFEIFDIINIFKDKINNKKEKAVLENGRTSN